MSVQSRLPALGLLGLVLVAAVLLVAGYGVGVGVGVLAGLVLGVLVVFAALSRNPGARSSAQLSSWGSGGGSPDPAILAVLERHGRDSQRVAGVDASALVRVIPIGDAVEMAGARVELIAIEIRQDGAIATVVAHTRPPVGTVGQFVEFAVSDDAGTAYVATGHGSGGASPGASRLDLRFSPEPPAGARMLTLTIEAFFDPFPGRTSELRGPWEFHISL